MIIEQFSEVNTKHGPGIVERIDTDTYSVPMFIIRLADDCLSDHGNTYVVKTEGEITLAN